MPLVRKGLYHTILPLNSKIIVFHVKVHLSWLIVSFTVSTSAAVWPKLLLVPPAKPCLTSISPPALPPHIQTQC